MILKYPWMLLLFLIYIPIIFWWFKIRKTEYPTLGVSSLSSFNKKHRGYKILLLYFTKFLMLAALGFIIVALARPQSKDSMSNKSIEGTDIVLALDISGSMEASDIQPSRFEKAKQLSSRFVENRPEDNLGLVIFSGEAISIMPLTNDLSAVRKAIENIRMGQLSNGTAIGDGLVSAINRVIAGNAKSKSIILLTDGSNNAGDVAPSTAADIAAQKGIKVYTIGVGIDGKMQVSDPSGFSSTTMETSIDEPTLKEIASKTGGKFFRATNAKALEQVFDEIDTLEKTRMNVEAYSRMNENFFPWVLAALCCVVGAMLINYTVLVKIP